MNPHLPWLAIAVTVATVALTACSKQEAPARSTTVKIVPETELSPSFLAVSRQLELGGTLYGYVDIDGDVLELAGTLNGFIDQLAIARPELAAYANVDAAELVTVLGLGDIKAVGVSSVPDGPGQFRNRMFLHTGGARNGLLAGLGGAPRPFKHVNLAPADASFYSEAESDLPAVYRAVKEIVSKVGGEPAGNRFETTLKQAGQAAALSVLDLIHGLKGHSAMVLRLDETKTLQLPGNPQPFTLPQISLLLCIEGIAPMIEDALAKSSALRRTDAGSRRIYELAGKLPLDGIQPVLLVEGSTLYVATTRGFLDECLSEKSGLAQSADFQTALARFGSEGNALSYVSPRFFRQVRRLQELNSHLPEDVRRGMDFVVARLPAPDRPLVTVRSNLPDGILVQSHLNRSLKQDVAMVGAYNPVTMGLLAAMAIPAFQKVRTASQEKAVLNNLRQLSAAADQYYLENGVSRVTFSQLVGPTGYIRQITPVAGEDYSQLQFFVGQPVQVQLSDGRVIQYP